MANVDNRYLKNKGGVITGNNYGYNTIVGTLNVTVKAATDLTKNIQTFTARVAIASQRLKLVADKISATSATLLSINLLVVRLAKKEGITIDQDAGGDGVRDRVEAENEGEGPSSILKKTCFKDLLGACRGATTLFNGITKKILQASSMIPPLLPSRHSSEQLGRTKCELNEDEREKIFLTELDIEIMEKQIESHKLEVQIALTVFQAILDDDRSETVEAMMLDMFKEIMSIKKYLLGHGPGARVPDMGLYQHGMIDLPLFWPKPLPNISRLISVYRGWTLAKAQPSVTESRISRPSWKSAVASMMAFSTEELFLMVLAQIYQRTKLNRTLQDDFRTLLRSKIQRMLVDNFRREQNALLQRNYPQLEWKLAGLAVTHPKSGQFSDETRIEVILKTEWALGPRPGGLLGRGQSGTIPNGVGVGVGRGRTSGTEHGRRHIYGGPPPGGVRLADREAAAYLPTHDSHPPIQAKGARIIPPKVLREPQYVFVREWGPGKSKSKDEEDNGRRMYHGNDRRRSRVFVELRYPSSPRIQGDPGRSSRLDLQGHSQPHPGAAYRHAAQDDRVESTVDPTREMTEELTPEQEKQIINELFAEWEEVMDDEHNRTDMHANPRKAAATQAYSSGRAWKNYSDMGTTRRLMTEVERASQMRGTIELNAMERRMRHSEMMAETERPTAYDVRERHRRQRSRGGIDDELEVEVEDRR